MSEPLNPSAQRQLAIARAQQAMPEWSRQGRQLDWDLLGNRTWDVLVVGGGITGCGVALDAAARGLSVALVEKHDFASGTSSRSSKLVHGGLRYLREGQFAVTWESSREKRCIKKLAPHLVDDLAFMLAAPKGRLGRWKLNLGLWIYDFAAGFPKGLMHRSLSPTQAEQRLPGLSTDLYDGGFLYYDGRADDCRLTMHVAKAAVLQSAMLLNYAKVVDLEQKKGRVCGAVVRDVIRDQVCKVHAKVVVNATGVWCDELLQAEEKLVRPSMGVHLVFDAVDLPCQDAIVVPTPGSDGAVFLIRDGDHVLVGTTDSFFDGPLDQPRALPDHVDLILMRLNAALPHAKIGREHVRSSFAGLRPLLQAEGTDSKKLSRDEVILGEAPGMISVSGGKLTTYRKMAADVVDRIAAGLKLATKKSFSEDLLLFTNSRPSVAVEHHPNAKNFHLNRAYGSEITAIQKLAQGDAEMQQNLIPEQAPTVAEGKYLLHHERAVRLSDILCRRTRLANYAWAQCQEHALKIAVTLRQFTDWDAQQEVQNFWQESTQFQEAEKA